MKRPKNEREEKQKIYFKTVKKILEKDKIENGDIEKHSYELKDFKKGELLIFKKINNLRLNPEIKKNNEIIKNKNSLLLSVDNNKIVVKKQKILMKDNRMEIEEELINPDVELIGHKDTDPKQVSDTNDITYDIDYDKLFDHHTQLKTMYSKIIESSKMEHIMNEFK